MNRICYLGDDDVSRAAVYLSGIMTHYGFDFDRIDSSESPRSDFFDQPYSLYILSDYPRCRLNDTHLEFIAAAVEHGAGLLMIGGWESFHGRLGEYDQTILKEVLPVKMLDHDDRRNYAQPCVIVPTKPHPITAGLPWTTPPCVGGFNAITPKDNADVLMEIHRFGISAQGVAENRAPSFDFHQIEVLPLLIAGQFGQGRTAALATDVAPHWVGGFVDWGTERLVVNLSDGAFIDVGADYARFFSQMIQFLMK